MRRTFQTLSIGIGLLGLNLWVVAPFLTRTLGEMPANIIYLLLRLVILIVLGGALFTWAKRKRIQAVSLVSLAAFFDQVIWKGLWIALVAAKDMPEWREAPTVQIAMNLMMSYVLFMPFILVLAFVGVEVGAAAAKKWKWKF